MMTEQEKQLLLADLCARLPYGTIIHTWYGKSLDIKYTGVNVYTNTIDLDIPEDDDACVYADNVKPYLRPLSSMTEEEKGQTRGFWIDADTRIFATRLIDFYNKNHFDYRGLIPKGLALEVPKEMYT